MCQAVERYGDDREFIGRKEGRAEGRKEGRAEGRKEGRAEGRKEGEISVIKSMLKKGFSVEAISDATNIPLDEVKKIAEK